MLHLLAQATTDQQPWSHHPLFLALMAAAIGAVTGQLSQWLGRRASRDEAREALTVALAAELGVVHQLMHVFIQSIKPLASKGQATFLDFPSFPCDIYRANLHSIGRIGDSSFAYSVAMAYTGATTLNRMAEKMVEKGDFKHMLRYIRFMIAFYPMAAAGHAAAEHLAEKYIGQGLGSKFRVSDELADDVNDALRILQSLDDWIEKQGKTDSAKSDSSTTA